MEETNTRPSELRIAVTRGTKHWTIRPSEFDDLSFEDGDRLEVQPGELAARLPDIWGVKHVPVTPGRAIQVPSVYRLFSYRGYRLPAHLVFATGVGTESFDTLARGQFANYVKFVGFDPGMTIADVGCGIGRLAFQLLDFLGPDGRYHGVDAIRDSIRWCQRNITPRHANFTFQHADARNEVYNPHGSKSSREIGIALADGSVDRAILSSLLTHLLEDEVVHYLKELRRILKARGLAYATLFLHSAEAIEAAKAGRNLKLISGFGTPVGNGAFGDDPAFARGAVAYTDEAVQRMIAAAGLRQVGPYIKGWWSGLHGEAAEEGQDAVILARA